MTTTKLTRVCNCKLCLGSDEPTDRIVELVTTHGHAVCGVLPEDGIPPWAYTSGLWHSYGSPEVAMFGLELRGVHYWTNKLAQQVKDGNPIVLDVERHGILDDYPVMLKAIHPSWFPMLFGSAIDFAQLPPLAMAMIVWPDKNGRWPWEAEAGARCKRDQPKLWLPHAEHPRDIWYHHEELIDWPFPDTDVDAHVTLTRRILDGTEPIHGVLRDEHGDWTFLGKNLVPTSELVRACLYHVVVKHPEIRVNAQLQPGQESWRTKEKWTTFDTELTQSA
jgi:hypothetical protein